MPLNPPKQNVVPATPQAINTNRQLGEKAAPAITPTDGPPSPILTNGAILAALAYTNEPGRDSKNGVDHAMRAAAAFCKTFNIDPNAPFTIRMQAATAGKGEAQNAK
jgi:hypothetical protein